MHTTSVCDVYSGTHYFVYSTKFIVLHGAADDDRSSESDVLCESSSFDSDDCIRRHAISIRYISIALSLINYVSHDL